RSPAYPAGGGCCGRLMRRRRGPARGQRERRPRPAVTKLIPVSTETEPQPEAGVEPERPEPDLDPETAARRDAALAQIRSFGDPVLRTKARKIERFDDALREEVERMSLLMDDALGVGLAATQVGVVHRLLVYRVMQQGPLAALINPEVEWSSRDSEPMEEGCLSLPGVLVEVDRPLHVRVRALNEYGEP